jgi:hypothetical protein
MSDREVIRIPFDGLETVTMGKDQHIEVTTDNILQAALAYILATGPIAVNRLVSGRHEPIHDSLPFLNQISIGG